MGKSRYLVLLTSLVLTLAGCGKTETGNSSDSSQVETTAETTSVTTTEALPEEPELTYLERCEEIMAELPPKEILEEREGVEYPTFEKFYYYSNTAERDTPVNVLLPAGYSEEKEYPVLYVLHGYWDNEDWMARDNVHFSTMLTNLIADGEAEEMIVVCPYIFTSKDLAYCTGMDTDNTLAYDNFINDLTTDLMPFIEESFSVAKGRENTAITGFSMGARESLYIGFTYPDRFGYLGSVCTAPGLVNGTGWPYNLEPDQLTFDEGQAPELILLSAAVNDGVVGQNPMTYHQMLSENGIQHLWHTMSGTGHDASSVTPHLYNFLRMTFKA